MNSLADLLKQLREARGLSQRALAQRAGVSHGAISRWERGAFWPRLRELEAVLTALEAGPRHRKRALSLIEAPRAVVRMHAKAEQGRADFVAAVGPAPLAGDLLRALRFRRGLTLDEVASAIGVRASTLSRWERSEMWPEAERLHALCFLLRANEEETTALLCSRFHLPELAAQPTTIEEWLAVVHGVYFGPDALRDLHLLALESRLWRLSARYAEALEALEPPTELIWYEAEARARHRLLEAECWLGMGKISDARATFLDAQQTIDTHSQEFLRPQADALARRL